jgi:hypothetical protein
MHDLSSTISESLHDRADRGVRAAGLHDRAVARARRYRRNRRMAVAATGAGVTAAAVAAAIAMPNLLTNLGHRDGGGVMPAVAVKHTTAPPVDTGPTTLPRLAGVAGAAARPVLVGTDPAALHFDVDLTSLGITEAVWTSAPGYEAMETPETSSGTATKIYLSGSKARLDAVRPAAAGLEQFRSDGTTTSVPGTFESDPVENIQVGGRPATIQHSRSKNLGGTGASGAAVYRVDRVGAPTTAWTLDWQPADGLYAEVVVVGGDRNLALAAVAALRPDRAQRCAVPVRLAALPAGAAWTRCVTQLRTAPGGSAAGGGLWQSSRLVLSRTGGGGFDVYLEMQPERVAHDLDQYHPSVTVQGHPAAWLDHDPRGLWIMNFGPMEVFIGGAGENDPLLTKPDTVAVAQGLVLSDNLADPSSWPAEPIG